MDPAEAPNLRAQRIAKATLALLLALFGLWISATFLPALVWAGVIGIAIDPLYTRAECRWPQHRGILLPGVATFLTALLVLTPLALATIEAAREAGFVMQWFEQVRTTGMPEPAWLKSLPMAGDLSAWWQANLATPEAAQRFQPFHRGDLIEHSQLVGRGLIRRGIVFAFTLVALFFLLRERDTLVAQLKVAGRRWLGASAGRIGVQIIRSVRGTIDGLVLVGLAEGAVMTIVYLVASVPHPLLLGMLTAVAAMIPFGAAVLFGVASALLIAQGAVAWAVAVFAIGMFVVFIADHFARPVLIGGSTRLPFLWVLIGILGGVESLGLLGLFVGPAVMATLILLWRDYVGAGISDGSGSPATPAGPPPPDCG